MIEILAMGLLIGMRHALEADHVAAVASLVSRHSTFSTSVRMGTFWGLGHTLTLLLFGSLVLFSGQFVPDRLASSLEFAVGGMLVWLGADVMRRLWREQVSWSWHQHGDMQHIHALRGAGSEPHEHTATVPWRALMVGMMHGMAGSAALIVLTLQTVGSALAGVAYILCFGLGSVVGMAAMSAVMVVPMRHAARRTQTGLPWFQGVIGMATLGIGCHIMLTHV